MRLTIEFGVRNVVGRVDVTVVSNDDPAAQGFPVCEAIVDTPLRGYQALLGWVQVVGTRDSPDGDYRFETDPLRVFDHLDLPFGFHGLNPTLFDAPSRRNRAQYLDWLAHSFLCASPGDPMDRTIEPVAAFQWGFVLDSGDVSLPPPEALALAEWDRHRAMLATAYPSWRFLS